jgi:hypothetical protein
MSEPVILLPSHQMNFQFTVRLVKTNRTLKRNFPREKSNLVAKEKQELNKRDAKIQQVNQSAL